MQRMNTAPYDFDCLGEQLMVCDKREMFIAPHGEQVEPPEEQRRLNRQRRRQVVTVPRGVHTDCRRSRPFISEGCFSPSTPRSVGAISCSAPPERSFHPASLTRMKGTGLVV